MRFKKKLLAVVVGLSTAIPASAQIYVEYRLTAHMEMGFLDVLSHKGVPSETEALLEVGRVLKKGGHLLVLDSAFHFIHGQHDLACHIMRRYVRRTMDKICRSAGFEPVRRGYFNFFMFPGVAAIRLLQKIQKPKSTHYVSNLRPINSGLNAILEKIMRTEARLTRSLNLPYGSTVFCLARKI